MRTTLLADVVDPIVLPDDVIDALERASSAAIAPQCTPAGDVDELRDKLVRGERRVDRLLADVVTTAPMPGDVALLGALVAACVSRVDVVVDGNADAHLDQTVMPRRGHVGVSGSLHVRGNLEVTAPLLVCGDLVVDGVLTDCGPQSVVVVLGTLRCRALVTSGEVLVGGDLEASAFVHGRYNDNVLEVVGTLGASAVVADDHAVEAGNVVVRFQPNDEEPIFDGSSEHDAVLQRLVPEGVFKPDRHGALHLDVRAWAHAAAPRRDEA